ncbi:MAG: hypothetical protein ACRD3V_18440 [Vicinamibacteria bacterium]
MVLGGERSIAAHAEAHDAGRIGIVAHDADYDRLATREHSHHGAGGSRCALQRVRLGEAVDPIRCAPRRLI